MPPNRLAVLVLAAAAGCTPLHWVRQDTGPEQFRQDMAQCQQEAWREASWRSSLYRPLAPLMVEDAYGRRFLAWPRSPFNDPWGERFFEESRLTSFCMRAKGYELVPADKIQPSPGGTSAGKP
jgi:hypothetical protein